MSVPAETVIRSRRGFRGWKKDNVELPQHKMVFDLIEASIDSSLMPSIADVEAVMSVKAKAVAVIKYTGQGQRQVLHEDDIVDYAIQHTRVEPFHAVNRVPDTVSIRRVFEMRYNKRSGIGIYDLLSKFRWHKGSANNELEKQSYLGCFACFLADAFKGRLPIFGEPIQTAPITEHCVESTHCEASELNYLSKNVDDTNYRLCTRYTIDFQSLELQHHFTTSQSSSGRDRINLRTIPINVVFDPFGVGTSTELMNVSFRPTLIKRLLVLEVRKHDIAGHLPSWDMIYLNNLTPVNDNALLEPIWYEKCGLSTGRIVSEASDIMDTLSSKPSVSNAVKPNNDEWTKLISPAYVLVSTTEVIVIPESLRVICTLFEREQYVWRQFILSFRRHAQWVTTLVYKGEVQKAVISRVLADLSLLDQLLQLAGAHRHLLNRFLAAKSELRKPTLGSKEASFATWWTTEEHPLPLHEAFPVQHEYLSIIRVFFTDTVIKELEFHKKQMEIKMQLCFNIVSIDEAERSRQLNTSLKRLSWITFVFLPLLFVASLFGMNIDLLAYDPRWWWYFVVSVPTGCLIAFVWWMYRVSTLRELERHDEIDLGTTRGSN